jgi:hypothetical protein
VRREASDFGGRDVRYRRQVFGFATFWVLDSGFRILISLLATDGIFRNCIYAPVYS